MSKTITLVTMLRFLGIPKALAEGYAKQHRGYGSTRKTLDELRQHVLLFWYPGQFNEITKEEKQYNGYS